MKTYKKNVVIFGGGIAGIWILNVLKSFGYNACLIEKDYLGGMQTLASQGMIHGGQKYTLTGKSSKHATNVAEMPAVWASCFNGDGLLDLSKVKTLSDYQIMWSNGNMASNLTVFMAAKAVNGNTEKLDKDSVPEVLKLGDGFKGQAYKLSECVMDARNLLENMIKGHEQDIYQADLIEFNNKNGKTESVIVKDSNENKVKIISDMFIFASGKGNEEFSDKVGFKSDQITQRRPLKQIMIKDLDYPIYGHLIEANPKPRVTITAHPLDNGKYCWYLGGAIAEKAINMTDIEAINFAKSEMMDIFKEINWNNKEWSILNIDRAEPNQENGRLPEGAHFEVKENNIIAWPSKLTFAPSLGSKIINYLENNNYKPSLNNETIPLNKAEIGKYPWEIADWIKL